MGSEDGLSSSLGDLESTSPLTGAASLRELHPGNTSYCAFAPYDLSSSLGLAAVASSTPERTPGYRIIYNIIAAHGVIFVSILSDNIEINVFVKTKEHFE